MLRAVRLELSQLSADSPYLPARLRRITDQLTFIVQTWEGRPWPTYSRQGQPVPSLLEVLGQLAHLPPEPGARQQALLALVLLLL
jgi:hypothetical protein